MKSLSYTLEDQRQTTCPLVGVRYSVSESNELVEIYVEDWHKCGKLCENHVDRQEKCKFWTFWQNSEIGNGYCSLLSADEGMYAFDGGDGGWGSISGYKGCYWKVGWKTTSVE